MRRSLRITILLGVILALILILAGYWRGTPRIVAVSPEDGAAAVPAREGVRISFSRPMQHTAIENSLSFEPDIQGNIRWEGDSLIFEPGQGWPAGVKIQARLDARARATGLLPLPLRQKVEWSFTIRQPSLVYLYPAAGPANLYLFDPGSNESQPLTDYLLGVIDFDISGDGAALYYSSRQENGSAIYRLRLGQDQIAAGESAEATPELVSLLPELVLACEKALCSGLTLAPEGSFLSYERSALPESNQPTYPQVWIAPLDSQGGTAPFLAGEPAHQTTLPVWAKNGWLAVYDTDAAAYLFIEPGAGERTRFENQTGQAGAWHPSGNAFLAPEINFLDANFSPSLSDLEPLADSHLILFDLQSGATQDLTPEQGTEDTTPVFSPDGNYLAFARKYLDPQRWTPGRQLWVAKTDSREARPLTDQPLYNHYQFAWSPSGEQLAYVRFNQSLLTEPPEIWVLNLLSGVETRSAVGGYSPKWIP
jgi:hypothetical protein